MGRFGSRDPLLVVQEMNRLTFVANSPFQWVDPVGNQKTNSAQCAKYLADIAKKIADLAVEFDAFDALTDFTGDYFKDKFDKIKGVWVKEKGSDNGHREKMENLQRGIKKDIEKFKKYCMNCDDDPPPPSGFFDEALAWAKKKIPTLSEYKWLVPTIGVFLGGSIISPYHGPKVDLPPLPGPTRAPYPIPGVVVPIVVIITL